MSCVGKGEYSQNSKRTEIITNHYAGPGNSPAWTVNTAGEYTRNIAGLTGFAAVQNNTEAPVLQLTNLHGDVIGTAYLSETATALASTADTSEFGVPTTSLPPKYSWLGADEIPTELPSGVIDMGARSYVPQLGRFLQPDPIPGGSANAYTYTFGDPVNTSDPSGEFTYGFAAWAKALNNQQAQEVVAREVARETLEREEAERRVREAREAEERADDPAPAAEEEPLGGSAGWACEYAAETGQEDSECGGGGGAGVGGGGGSSFAPITYKGGPGAFCGSNSPSHRKYHQPGPGNENESIATCGVLGNIVGGFLGGLAADGPGAFAGGYGGGKLAEKACKAV
jgi:RHS repeat-associated protein